MKYVLPERRVNMSPTQEQKSKREPAVLFQQRVRYGRGLVNCKCKTPWLYFFKKEKPKALAKYNRQLLILAPPCTLTLFFSNKISHIYFPGDHCLPCSCRSQSENICPHKYEIFHSVIIHGSQEVETIQISTQLVDGTKKQKTVVQPYYIPFCCQIVFQTIGINHPLMNLTLSKEARLKKSHTE